MVHRILHWVQLHTPTCTLIFIILFFNTFKKNIFNSLIEIEIYFFFFFFLLSISATKFYCISCNILGITPDFTPVATSCVTKNLPLLDASTPSLLMLGLYWLFPQASQFAGWIDNVIMLLTL